MRECLLCQQMMIQEKSTLGLIFLNERESFICEECSNQFEKIKSNHCPNCYKVDRSAICEDCKAWRGKGYEVKHEAIYTYNESMKDYFQQYKFLGDRLLGKVFANDIKKRLKKYKEYTIVPIPVSEERKRKRGFNQVETFLEYANISYSKILLKTNTTAQSKKNRLERLETKQSFYLKTEKNLPEKILLIDDIYTTGKTLELACSLLIEKGVKEVKTFSLAR